MVATFNQDLSIDNGTNVTKKSLSNCNSVKKENGQNDTFERLDFDSLKRDFPLDDVDVLINVLKAIDPKLEFKKKQGSRYEEKDDSSLNLKKGKDGWYCHDFGFRSNDNARSKLPSGNAYNLTARHLNTNFQDKDSLFEFWEFIANANGSPIYSYITNEPRKQTDWKKAKIERQKKKVQHKIDSIAKISKRNGVTFTSNEKGEITRNYDYQIASWNSDLGIAVLEYWEKKFPKKFGYLLINEQIELLETNGIYPCKWIKKKGKFKLQEFTPENIGILHISGKNVKLKTPYAKPFIDKNGKKVTIKWRTLVSAGNYIFGLDNLPKEKVKLLLIASGESDTLTYNLTHNEINCYAVSFGSEVASLPKETIDFLKSRCETLAICYDADSTGLNNAKKLSRQHNLPYINLDMGTDEKVDLCTLAKRGEFCTTMYKKTEKAFFTKYVESNPLDPYSIGDIEAVRIPTKRYAGDNTNVHPINGLTPYQMYVDALVNYDRLNFFALPGVGKSWLNIALSTDKEALARIGVKRVIFCVPTSSILGQLENDFIGNARKLFISEVEKWTSLGTATSIAKSSSKEQVIKELNALVINLPSNEVERLANLLLPNYTVLDGLNGTSDALVNSTYDIIITTHNSAHKLLPLAKDALVIIDEAHKLRNSVGFKDNKQADRIKTNRHAFALVENAKKGVLVSATPLLEMSKIKDYKLVMCESEQNQKHVIQPIYYNATHKTGLINDIDKRENLSKGKHLIMFNHVDALEAFKASLSEKYPNLRIEIISSKKSAYKSDNEVYNSIMDTGHLPIGTDNIVILTTSLMDTGVSFRFSIDSVTAIRPNHHQPLIQLIHRPRMYQDASGNMVNEVIKVYTYHPSGDIGIIDNRSPLDKLKRQIERDRKDLQDLNTTYKGKGNQSAHFKYNSKRANYYYCDKLEKYIYDFTSALYNEIYLNEIAAYTDSPKAMYKRIDFENSFVTVLNGIDAYLEIDKIVKDNLKKAKRTAKADKVASIKMLKSNSVKIEGTDITTNGLNAIASTVIRSSNNRQLKTGISSLMESGIIQDVIKPIEINDIGKENLAENSMKDIISKNGITDIEALERPMERVITLHGLGVPIDQVMNLINTEQSDGQFRILHDTIVTQSELRRHKKGKELEYEEVKRIEGYKKMKQAMNKNKGRRVFTKEEIVDFVTEVLKPSRKIGFENALSKIAELYEFEKFEERKGRKKKVTFKFGYLHNSQYGTSEITNLFKKHGDKICDQIGHRKNNEKRV
ncbi:MAG: DEAD/DEAH box helicase family protein [Chitinophagales bacterium]